VINSARVFRPWDGIEASNLISDGVAENSSSINRIGRRHKTISDSSIDDATQAADRAAAFVAANSSAEVRVVAEILHDPRPSSTPNAAGESYLPLLSAIKNGTVTIPVPFQERSLQDRSDRGDCVSSVFEPPASDVVSLKHDPVNAAAYSIDCRTGAASTTVPNAPAGLYSGSPDLVPGGDLNKSITVYDLQMKWTDSSELTDGGGAGVLLKSLAVCEWDRQMYFMLVAQGTTPQTYAPYLGLRNSSGVWGSAGAFTNTFGSVITKAQVEGGIDIVCGLASDISGTKTTQLTNFYTRIYIKSGSADNPSGARTLIYYGVRSVASTSSMATDGDRVFIVNKVEGTNGNVGTNYPQLSKSVDISGVSVYGSLGELNSGSTAYDISGKAFVAFSDQMVYQQPLYKYSRNLLVDAHMGCSRAVESSDVVAANTARLVHLAYVNTGVDTITGGGDFSHVVSATSGTGMTSDSAAFSRKHSTWLLGPGDTGYASALGPDLSVSPRVVTCRLQNDKIRILIEGNGRPSSATYTIESSSEEINEVLRNQRIGQE
jgi:hypothetical protein